MGLDMWIVMAGVDFMALSVETGYFIGTIPPFLYPKEF